MKKYTLFLVLNLIIAGLAHAKIDIKTYKYTFSPKEQFKVAFADYPKGQEKLFELNFQNNAPLPSEIHTKYPSLKISGNNHSDDLFMYAYKKISGLKPDTPYQVSFSLEFASNAAIDSFGVGGSPGDGVYVKIGAVPKEPERYLDDSDYYRINLDKGNQGQGGKDMMLIGTIAVDTQESLYRLKTVPYYPNKKMQNKLNKYTITTNNQGEVWIVFGTDSGFEYTTSIFYTNLSVSFKEREANDQNKPYTIKTNR